MKRAVFLDRDGVLNEAVIREGKPYPPADVTAMRIPAGTAEALERLKERGYLLIVVTNQPDVHRGRVTRETVAAMNAQLRDQLPLDDVFTCYHDDGNNCDCRKPKPGLMMRAAQQYGIDLKKSFMIGDRWRDIDAGANAGCKTILIDLGYKEREPASPPNFRASSLRDAAEWILSNYAENVCEVSQN
jgi:D-glycero-D-manno-heptose 1,7-bisphosphate phosphatase